jgi:CMP-N-acetylneuraminic acid synthetase
MNIVGIIPARGGSKRLPRKNVKLLAGKPLIALSIEAGLQSKYIDKVVISTEDKEIADIAQSFGAEVIARPHELAQDETKTAPVLLHVVEELEKKGYKPDIVVLLQATCPNKTPELIDSVIEKLINSNNDSVFTARQFCYSMALWRKDHSGKLDALYDYHLRPRWQDASKLCEVIYGENGAVYAIKADAFKKCSDFIGENPDIVLSPPLIDIDTQEDFDEAERLLLSK